MLARTIYIYADCSWPEPYICWPEPYIYMLILVGQNHIYVGQNHIYMLVVVGQTHVYVGQNHIYVHILVCMYAVYHCVFEGISAKTTLYTPCINGSGQAIDDRIELARFPSSFNGIHRHSCQSSLLASCSGQPVDDGLDAVRKQPCTSSCAMHKQRCHAQAAVPCTSSGAMHKQLCHAQAAVPCTSSSAMHKQLCHAQAAVPCTCSGACL